MEYKLTDSVWHRVVQIIQEAMLMGIDCADLLRQVRLKESDETGVLDLSDSYREQVESMHEKYLADLEERLGEKEANVIDVN